MSLKLLLLVSIFSAVVNGQRNFKFLRSPGGVISPREQNRSFSRKSSSFNFYPSRELIDRELHYNGNELDSTYNNGYSNNQGFEQINNDGYSNNFGTTNGNGYKTKHETNSQRQLSTRNVESNGYKSRNEYSTNDYRSTNGFTTGFGSTGLQSGVDSYNKIGLIDSSYNNQFDTGASSYYQQPLIQKNVYIHIPPPELEDVSYPTQSPIPVGPPEKNYKIIFIKAPSPPKLQQTVIPAQPPKEEKTLVYVLVKKPEEPPQPVTAAPQPTQPSKPEVFFIPYKSVKEEDGYAGSKQEPNQSYGVPNYRKGEQGLYGQATNEKPNYLHPNKRETATKNS